MTQSDLLHLEVWAIPLMMTSQADPNFDNTTVVGLHRGGQHIINNLPATDDQWIIFNNKQVGQ